MVKTRVRTSKKKIKRKRRSKMGKLEPMIIILTKNLILKCQQ
jgi:hypothetical protein